MLNFLRRGTRKHLERPLLTRTLHFPPFSTIATDTDEDEENAVLSHSVPFQDTADCSDTAVLATSVSTESATQTNQTHNFDIQMENFLSKEAGIEG